GPRWRRARPGPWPGRRARPGALPEKRSASGSWHFAATIISRGKIMKKQLFTMLMAVLPSLAQTTIKDALVKHWKVTEDFTLAVAKMMPADSYGFKPVPEELSFGQLMIQIGRANLNACANASGMERFAIPVKL